MAMFDNTMPREGDELLHTLQKICQICTTGAVGPITPVMYDNTSPVQGDEILDSAKKINQILHVNGGL